jgi:hypothetical protein
MLELIGFCLVIFLAFKYLPDIIGFAAKLVTLLFLVWVLSLLIFSSINVVFL